MKGMLLMLCVGVMAMVLCCGCRRSEPEKPVVPAPPPTSPKPSPTALGTVSQFRNRIVCETASGARVSRDEA